VQRLAPTYATKRFSSNRDGWLNGFNRTVLVHTHQRPQSPGWETTLDITFHRKIALQIRQICLQLKTFGALWLQLFMPAQGPDFQKNL